jgi:3-deoxy-D-manno-octulosonic-acid transferase
MVKESKLKGLKVILFSATFSAPRSGIWRWLSSFVFSPIDQIFCVNDEDQKNALSFIDANKLKVLGDTRYDQVLWRLQQKPPWLDQLEPWKNEKIFIAGSTWPEDEKILFAAFENIKQYGFKIILAPHEVHADKIVKTLAQFKTMNLQVLLWSHFLTLPVNDQASHLKNCAVLLVDQVGILADLYSLSMVAFVGGSFKHKVHSVMEPLAAGNIVLVGPHHHNNREALVAKNVHLKLSGLNAVHEIQNSSDIQDILLKMQKADPADIKSFIKDHVAQQSGASQHLVDLVL